MQLSVARVSQPPPPAPLPPAKPASAPPLAPSRPWPLVPLVAVLLLAAYGLRLWLLGVPSLWYDEGVSWSLARSPLPTLIAHLAGADFNPPLYVLLLHWWLPLAGSSEFALRLPSADAGVLTVALSWALARHALRSTAAAVIAAGLTAGSVFLIDFSGEARAYTLVTAAGVLSAYALLRLLTTAASERALGGRWWWTYVLATAAALYAHYAAVLLLPAHVLLVALQRRRTGAVLAAWLATATLYAPWLPGLRAQLAIMRATPDFWLGAGRPLLAPERAIAAILAGPGTFPNRARSLLVVGGVALLLGAAAALARRHGRLVALFPTLLVLLPLVEAALITARVPKFIDRYLLVAAPFAYVAAAGALTWGLRVRLKRPLPSRLLRWSFAALSVLTLVAAGGQASRHAPQGAAAIKDGDTRKAVAFINSHAQPGDAVLLAQDTGPVFSYYYNGALGPEGVGWFPLSTEFSRGDDLPRLAAELTQAAKGHRRFWLLLWHADFADPTGYLRNELGVQTDHVLTYLDARGYDLRLYNLRPTSTFSPNATPLQSMSVRFGPHLTFLGDGLEHGEEQADQPFAYHIWFRTDAPLDRDYQLVLRLERDGHTWAQTTQRPSLVTYPTSHWLPGIDVPGVLYFAVGPLVPPGDYQVTLSVFDPLTQQDLPAVDATRGPIGTRLDLGTVQVSPPGQPAPTVAPKRPLNAAAASGLRLLGLSGLAPSVREGAAGDLTLFWQASGPARPDVTVQLQLATSAGVYPLGPLAPPAPGLGTAAWPPGSIFEDERTIVLPPRLPGGQAALQARIVFANGSPPRVLALGPLTVEPRPRLLTEPAAIGHPVGALFGGAALLAGIAVDDRAARPGGQVLVTLTWQCKEPLDQEYTVFVHLLDSQNQIGGRQHDGPPNAGADPTTSWAPGQWIIDRHSVPIPASTPPGAYRIEVGLYRLVGQQFLRLPLATGGNAALLGTVTVRP